VQKYLGSRGAEERYSSFDYCFNYFAGVRETGASALLDSDEQMQVACLQLGFYLASWGMYRGSSQLIRHSARRLEPTLEVIATSPEEIWSIDADDYSERNKKIILSYGEALREKLPGSATDTLVTKIMLGVFGCVPALDSYFRRGFGLSSSRPFRPKSLAAIGEYAAHHAEELRAQSVYTLDFASGSETSRRYTTAKIIDMVFFVQGSP
jgi:hypothetical protein